jgi:hypothetical protein
VLEVCRKTKGIFSRLYMVFQGWSYATILVS